MEKLKIFYIYLYDCDKCGSYKHARTTKPNSHILAIRCPHCYKLLGWMDYRYLGMVKARGDFEALKIYRESLRGKNSLGR